MPAILEHFAQSLRSRPLVKRSVLAARRVHAQFIERSLNIDTVTMPAIATGLTSDDERRPLFDDPERYDVMDYPLLWRYLRPLELNADDVVFDVGCGMGRMICTAARLGVRRCVGIEIDPTLAQRAKANAQSLREPKAPIDVHCVDAAAADYSACTVLCLFNPFGPATLCAMLRRLHRSIMREPRVVRIGYNNPVLADLLDECGWLQRYGHDESPWYQHASAYWRSVMPAS